VYDFRIFVINCIEICTIQFRFLILFLTREAERRDGRLSLWARPRERPALHVHVHVVHVHVRPASGVGEGHPPDAPRGRAESRRPARQWTDRPATTTERTVNAVRTSKNANSRQDSACHNVRVSRVSRVSSPVAVSRSGFTHRHKGTCTGSCPMPPCTPTLPPRVIGPQTSARALQMYQFLRSSQTNGQKCRAPAH
jgi:hypothetical protein